MSVKDVEETLSKHQVNQLNYITVFQKGWSEWMRLIEE